MAVNVDGFTRKRTEIRFFNWEIPNFLSRIEDKKFDCIESPEFSFSGCIWKLELLTSKLRIDRGMWIKIWMQLPFADTRTVSYTVSLFKGWPVDPKHTVVGTKTFGEADRSLLIVLRDVNLKTFQATPFDTRIIMCRLEAEIPTPPGRVSKTSELIGVEKLALDFKNLLLSEEGSDGTLRVKGHTFRVHRSILKARAPVLYAMFHLDSPDIVDIEDCEPDIFRIFLQCVYTGEAEDLSPMNATDLYEIAKKYQLEELQEDCLECIKRGLSVESVCRAMSLALKHDESELTMLAKDFFFGSVKKIIQTAEWEHFVRENPVQANDLKTNALKKSRAVKRKYN